MRESEQWRLVAERVAEGMPFTIAVRLTLGRSFTDTRAEPWDPFGDDFERADGFYENCATIFALLLAEEAEDEENMNTIHVTYCAEEPPMPAVFVGPEPEQDEPEVALGNYPVDRRRTWGEKVAQGMRKWADWVEARF